MTEESFDGLATLCIEKKLLNEIDINHIISDLHREVLIGMYELFYMHTGFERIGVLFIIFYTYI